MINLDDELKDIRKMKHNKYLRDRNTVHDVNETQPTVSDVSNLYDNKHQSL